MNRADCLAGPIWRTVISKASGWRQIACSGLFVPENDRLNLLICQHQLDTNLVKARKRQIQTLPAAGPNTLMLP